MDLEEFKKIYFMEWSHRVWGRVIGLSFVLPTIYFIARRRVTLRTAGALVGISALIGFGLPVSVRHGREGAGDGLPFCNAQSVESGRH